MSSTAISAQGSKLEISTGTGSATVPTAIAVGYPTIMTKSGHTLLNGDVVTFGGMTGADAATLNGVTATIKNVTSTTFAFDINTIGKTITVSGSPTVTPVTYTQVANVKSFSGLDGQASELDSTNLQSVAKEFLQGLVDNGQFTAELDNDNADAGQNAARAARDGGASKNFKLTLPDLTVASFAGHVKKKSISGAVDAIVKSSLDIRISGAVTWA